MNRGAWYVCATGKHAEVFAKAVGRWAHTNKVLLAENPMSLRSHLATQRSRPLRCVIAPWQEDLEPINIASALISDGVVQDVYLVAEELTGSLVTRARHAQITEVLALAEFMDVSACRTISVEAEDEHQSSSGLDGVVQEDRAMEYIKAIKDSETANALAVVSERYEEDSRVSKETSAAADERLEIEGEASRKSALFCEVDGKSGMEFSFQGSIPAASNSVKHDIAKMPHTETLNRDSLLSRLKHTDVLGTHSSRQLTLPDVGHAVSVDTCENLDEPEGIVSRLLIKRRKGAGPVVSFVSGRGGVGKTTLVCTMAVLAAAHGLKVVVLDLDLSGGNITSYFGIVGICDLIGITHDQTLLNKLYSLGKSPKDIPTLKIVGPVEQPETAELLAPHIENIIASLSNSADIVLVDTSVTWTESIARALQMSDRVVFVADERASAVSSVFKTQKFATRLGIARTRFIKLLNRCDKDGLDKTFLNKVETGSITSTNFYVDDGGIPVSEAMSLGKAAEFIKTRNSFVASTKSVIDQLLMSLGKLPENCSGKQARKRAFKFLKFLPGRR